MKIAIEALGINEYGGGRTSTLNMLHGLLSQSKGNEYKIFLSKFEPSLKSKFNKVHQVISPTSHRLLQRVWAQVAIPHQIINYDLIHFTKNLSLFKIKIPSIVTIHDLTIFHYPHLFPLLDVCYWRTIQKFTLTKSSKIIAVSKSTARDISRFYQIEPEKIRVIYNSVSQIYRPSPIPEIHKIKQKYDLPDHYLLHVGRFDRKKNLSFLVRAFASLQNFDGILLLVGEDYKKSKDTKLLSTIKDSRMQNKVRILSGIPNYDMPEIYGGALAAVLTSFHEGFGLFPVEAMACGTPLIAHDAGVMREVAGDGAYIINSLSKKRFVNAMKKIINNKLLRDSLSSRGIKQAEKYKTKTTAIRTLAVYSEFK